MLLPAALFIILPIIVFVYPGIEKGIDITGGTLIIVRTDKTADFKAIEDSLARFNLTELKVVPFSGGIQIHFGTNKNLDNASRLIKNASSVLKSDPQQALSLCSQAYAEMQAFANVFAPQQPEQCVAEAQGALAIARESFKESLNKEIIKQLGLNAEEAEKIQYTEISPALGEFFWRYALYAIALATVLLLALMFVFFRKFVPVIAIIQAALFDVLCALTALTLLRIPFSITALSALLMLVGYSIDTDIMLTAKVLKGSGSPRENAFSAMNTGITMTGITIVTTTIMSIFSFIYGIDIILTISVVLLFGLLGDLLSTWFMNAPIIIWYVESRGKATR